MATAGAQLRCVAAQPTSCDAAPRPLVWAWLAVSPDAEPAGQHVSPLRALLTSSLGHASLEALLKHAAECAAAEGGGAGGSSNSSADAELAPATRQSIFGDVEEDDGDAGSATAATAAIEPKHLLAALLQPRGHVPGLDAALQDAGVDVAVVVDYLMGRTPPPQRSVTQSGGGAAGMSTGEGAEGDEPLGAASVSAWRGLDSAMQGLEQRTADLAACGYAASGATQLVLLQAYRWALRTGASAVQPAHVAAALLTDACLPRFRSGFASHPPAQAALELFAVLPGAACHRALLAVQAEMAAAAAVDSGSGGRQPPVPAAAPTPAPRTAVAAATAARELLLGYSRSGLLPSRAALEAIAGSLAQAAGPQEATAAGSGAGGGIGNGAGAADEAPLHTHAGQQLPAAVQLLCTCAALGYRLPAAALPALLLPDQQKAARSGGSSSGSSSSSSSSSSRSTGAADGSGIGPVAWLTPRCLNEWLSALAAHGFAPAPRSLRADDDDSQPAATRITSTSTASGGATCSTSGARAPPTQRCWPWLEQGVMCALAAASAWELAALAARLAALATAEPSWTRCAARATELAARCCLAVTPLWNGNRIYADLINTADALLDMAQLASAAAAAADSAAEGGSDTCGSSTGGSTGSTGGEAEGRDVSSWVAVWAALELPHAAARWRHKLAARLHKSGYGGEDAAAVVAAATSGRGRGSGRAAAAVATGGLLRRPLPREPEFPSFDQAGVLLGQAVDLASTAGRWRQWGAVNAGELSARVQQGNERQHGRDGESRLLPVGLVLNLLAVLQLQLRTCAAGPWQLQQVAAALQRLGVLTSAAGGVAAEGGQPATAAAEVAAVMAAAESASLRSVLHSRHVAWLAAAHSAYALEADSSKSGDNKSNSGSSSGSSSAAAGLARLLPSLVLGQVYRSWAPDLTPPVAAALHAACRQQPASGGSSSSGGSSNGGGCSSSSLPDGCELLDPQQPPAPGPVGLGGAWGRCLARLHYPLAGGDDEQQPRQRDAAMGAGTGAGAGAQAEAEVGAGAAAAVPAHVPYSGASERLGIRTLAMGTGGGSSRTSGNSGNGDGSVCYQVARPYPSTGNMPTLPPLSHRQRQRLQQHLRRLAGCGSRSRDSSAALPSQTEGGIGVAGFVGAGWCGGLTPGMAVALTHAALAVATDSSSEANTTTPSTSATGAPVPESHVVPPGSRPWRLQLPDADTVALAVALTRELPPDWLRADEMWLLHVTDRDAGMRQRLHATGTGAGAGTGGSGADALERQWAQWLAAAGDVQLARVMPAAAQQGLQGWRPETPDVPGAPATSSAHLSITTSAALPLVLVPSHTPPSAVRPLLPPVCRLELLLARRRTQAVQTLLALMWQGDWYRGDAASLARFSASELLYVLCALVRLKEEEELEERPLGWMTGDRAADAVLDMLACPTHAHLLAHPGVAWGVGAAHAAATAPGPSAGAAAATAGAYVPSDLSAEKRVRGQKLLDAAADVDEYASRVLQALQFLAASGGAASGVLGGGRLDPYRPLAAQGDALAGFEAHTWLIGSSSSSSHEGSGSSSSSSRNAAGSKFTGGGPEVGAAVEGVSIRGLRARRPEGGEAAARRWAQVLGSVEGVASLRWALRAWGHDPDKWMATSR